MPRKSNYKPSKIQTKAECYLCHKDMNYGLEHHHCLHGTGQRKLADADGLWVWLCRQCHSALHDTGANDRYLQALAQRTYINDQIKQGYPEDVAREIYFKRYGKFYDYEDGEMSKIFFTVPGSITGKQRPRFNRFTGRTYTPSKTHKYEDSIKAGYIAKFPSGMWVQNKEQPISIELEIHFKMPDSWSRKKKERNVGTYCLKHIDLDNIYKACTDALNGVAYPDDSQICEIKAVRKVWDNEEFVSIWLTELEGEE